MQAAGDGQRPCQRLAEQAAFHHGICLDGDAVARGVERHLRVRQRHVKEAEKAPLERKLARKRVLHLAAGKGVAVTGPAGRHASHECDDDGNCNSGRTRPPADAVGTDSGFRGIGHDNSVRCGSDFKSSQKLHGMRGRASAHVGLRLQAAADRRTFRLAEDTTAVGLIQLRTAHAGRLAVRHARNGAGDGRRDAARAAMRSTVHAVRVHEIRA